MNDKNRKILIFIIGLILLGIGCVIIFRVAGKKNDEGNSSIRDIQNINSEINSGGEHVDYSSYTIEAKKPIIYFYPNSQIEEVVKLGYPEKITCSYPKYDKDGWKIIAKPDGTLIDINTGRSLYSLYWEGQGSADVNLEEGFVIKGEESAEFLEEKLDLLGLTEREAEEFIVYWLPKLEQNKYNYIRFATTEEMNTYMPLDFSVEPDTLIRVLMQFKGIDAPIEVKQQEIQTPQRNGFVVVEWGGTELE